MKALRDYVSDFSGHSFWTRYFQIFLDIVSGQDIFGFSDFWTLIIFFDFELQLELEFFV